MKTEACLLAAIPSFAFIIAIGSLPLVERLSLRFHVVAPPYADAQRHVQIPLLGGAAITAAVIAAMAAARALPFWLLMGVAGLFALGVIDDAIALPPLKKFAGQLIIIVAVVWMAPGFGLAPWLLGGGLAVFWLLSTVNACNLIDGLDGLAGGIGVVAALVTAVIGLLHHDRTLTYQSLAIAGALSGFLLYNFHPASVFMGDCGALPLGLLLGVVAMRAGGLAAANSRLLRYVVPILIVMVPLLDTAIVSVSRLATATPVSRRGLDHSHHRLLLLGLGHRRAVVLCWSVALAAGLCALALAMMPHALALAVLPFVALGFALIGLFMIDLTFDADPPGVAYGRLRGLPRFILSLGYKRRVAEAVLDLALIVAAYFGAFLIFWNFTVNDARMEALLPSLPVVIVASYAAFAIAGVYHGIWRYAGIADAMRFANGAVLAGILVVLASLFLPINPPSSVTVLFVILLLNLLLASRLSFRALRRSLALLATPGERVVIIGAGETAEAAARFVSSGRNPSPRLVGFIDDDTFKLGKLMHGYRVLGTFDQLERIYSEHGFRQILIATESLPRERLALIWGFANLHRLVIKRFSIRVNEVGMVPEGSALSEPASGQVVA
ncbi:MAG: hypothetical protein ACREQX_04015 [Candidatus Binataceae bacterium]